MKNKRLSILAMLPFSLGLIAFIIIEFGWIILAKTILFLALFVVIYGLFLWGMVGLMEKKK